MNRILLTVSLTCSIVLAGCDSGFPASESSPAISEDSFVEAIVELRRAAAEESDGRIGPQRRDEILQGRGLAEEDLVGFVEVHGANVPFMNRIWTRVEVELTGQDPDDVDFDEGGLEALPGMAPDTSTPETPPEAPPVTPPTDAMTGNDGPPQPPPPGG